MWQSQADCSTLERCRPISGSRGSNPLISAEFVKETKMITGLIIGGLVGYFVAKKYKK